MRSTGGLATEGIKWTDLKSGDVLAFSPEFLKHIEQNKDTFEWFYDEIISNNNPPSIFPIKYIKISPNYIELEFHWEDEKWLIDKSGRLDAMPSSPIVFDIIKIAED